MSESRARFRHNSAKVHFGFTHRIERREPCVLHMRRTEESQLTVLHLVQPVDGGVARVVTDLVRAQAGSGLRPVVACPPGSPLALGAAAAGAEVHDWSVTRAPGPRLAGEVAAARRIVRASRPHVVHAHSAKAGLAYRIAVRGRVPTVFQPHAWSFEAVGGRTAELALGWERFGARWADHILCVSESERRTGQEAGIAARWSVIHNGIDLDRFRPGGSGDRAEARASLPLLEGVGRDAPLVVCVGKLTRQKGQDVLLRAWRRMPDSRRPAGPGGRRARPGRTGGIGPAWRAVHRILRGRAAVDPRGGRPRTALPLGGHGAGPAGGDGLRTSRRGDRRERGAGEPAARPRGPLPGAAGGSGGPGRGADRPAHRRGTARGTVLRALRHTRASFDVRRTAEAVAGLYQELVGMSGPTTRKRTER